ncbi:TetR/AcrR family transcriptional regulator [Spelaeicoccus albus]|uniref:AcrR family transcriptional regulator n=1 Tax=Spelaeicoccus albus TaxID=1280376 RepID=A0A7Z0D2C3_9MICO|nr:TetR/AcrR family transcriptional regulator [Spelaeicoccus albus]NYI67586.1 AcrR family transcriptional regulator [Spelaeicoccus albus]
MPRKGNSTPAEIMDVAMTLFVERGYDKTSLREIAEACGLTKAALYYYFRTKDMIVRAALDAYTESIVDLLDWLDATDPGPKRDVEFVDRLLAIFDGQGSLALRFTQSNPTVLAREDFSHRNVDHIRELVTRIAGPDPDPDAVLRATMAVGSLVLSAMPETPIGPIGDADSRRKAARALALEILTPLSARRAGC